MNPPTRAHPRIQRPVHSWPADHIQTYFKSRAMTLSHFWLRWNEFAREKSLKWTAMLDWSWSLRCSLVQMVAVCVILYKGFFSVLHLAIPTIFVHYQRGLYLVITYMEVFWLPLWVCTKLGMFSWTLSLCAKYFIRSIFVSISIKSLSYHKKIKILLYAIKNPFGPTVAEFFTLHLETKLLRRKSFSSYETLEVSW